MFTNWGRNREQGLGAEGPRGHTEKHSHAKTHRDTHTHTHTHTHTPQGYTAAQTDPETRLRNSLAQVRHVDKHMYKQQKTEVWGYVNVAMVDVGKCGHGQMWTVVNVAGDKCGHVHTWTWEHFHTCMWPHGSGDSYIWTHKSRHRVMEKHSHNTQRHTDMPTASLRPRREVTAQTPAQSIAHFLQRGRPAPPPGTQPHSPLPQVLCRALSWLLNGPCRPRTQACTHSVHASRHTIPRCPFGVMVGWRQPTQRLRPKDPHPWG